MQRMTPAEYSMKSQEFIKATLEGFKELLDQGLYTEADQWLIDRRALTDSLQADIEIVEPE